MTSAWEWSSLVQGKTLPMAAFLSPKRQGRFHLCSFLSFCIQQHAWYLLCYCSRHYEDRQECPHSSSPFCSKHGDGTWVVPTHGRCMMWWAAEREEPQRCRNWPCQAFHLVVQVQALPWRQSGELLEALTWTPQLDKPWFMHIGFAHNVPVTFVASSWTHPTADA